MTTKFKPDRFEMVSRVGKQFDEKLNSQKLMEELVNPCKKIHFQTRTAKPKLLSAERIMEKLHQQEESERPSVTVEKPKKFSDFLFSRQSRSEFYHSTRKVDAVPPIGYYSPNFEPVGRAAPSAAAWDKQSRAHEPIFTQSISSAPGKLSAASSLTTSSAPSFAKQLPRPAITKGMLSPNEQRFVGIPDSEVWSKTKKIGVADMAKGLPRKDLFPCRRGPVPIYNPKFNSVWKPVSQRVKFDKTSSRKTLRVPLNDLVYENISWSQVLPRVSSPDFFRTGHRPETDDSPLPLFMRSLNSRQGLHMLNEKMLRMSGAIPSASDPFKIVQESHSLQAISADASPAYSRPIVSFSKTELAQHMRASSSAAVQVT